MTPQKRIGLRTWIEVDRKAIAKNFKLFRSIISSKTKLMVVVKSNAYGHNLVDFSHEMEECGADFLAVDSVVEALKLRRHGITLPILVLGYILPEMIGVAVEQKVSFTVSSFETLKMLTQSKRLGAKRPAVHIKVDTGMHRQGFLSSDLPEVLKLLEKSRGKILVEGLFTHFAAAKNPSFPRYTENQIKSFREWQSAFKKAGYTPIVHAAATAGALIYPESHFDMVRIGIGLYGLWPSDHVKKALRKKITLHPALTWKTVIAEIKKLPKGSYIGYDLTEKLSRDSIIGLCPIGYWHGLPRALSSIGTVLINGRRAKILGRVSMGMITIDLTRVPNVKVGEEVILIGKSGKEENTAEMMAKFAGTIDYEIITRLNPLIKRIYL